MKPKIPFSLPVLQDVNATLGLSLHPGRIGQIPCFSTALINNPVCNPDLYGAANSGQDKKPCPIHYACKLYLASRYFPEPIEVVLPRLKSMPHASLMELLKDFATNPVNALAKYNAQTEADEEEPTMTTPTATTAPAADATASDLPAPPDLPKKADAVETKPDDAVKPAEAETKPAKEPKAPKAPKEPKPAKEPKAATESPSVDPKAAAVAAANGLSSSSAGYKLLARFAVAKESFKAACAASGLSSPDYVRGKVGPLLIALLDQGILVAEGEGDSIFADTKSLSLNVPEGTVAAAVPATVAKEPKAPKAPKEPKAAKEPKAPKEPKAAKAAKPSKEEKAAAKAEAKEAAKKEKADAKAAAKAEKKAAKPAKEPKAAKAPKAEPAEGAEPAEPKAAKPVAMQISGKKSGSMAYLFLDAVLKAEEAKPGSTVSRAELYDLAEKNDFTSMVRITSVIGELLEAKLLQIVSGEGMVANYGMVNPLTREPWVPAPKAKAPEAAPAPAAAPAEAAPAALAKPPDQGGIRAT